MLRADVVILGAGPAGATAALNLGPLRRVLLVDRRSEPVDRIGESLAPAARRLLAAMGLRDEFQEDGHLPCYSARSAWGSATPTVRDSISDLDGHGWLLDRRRFEERLRHHAVARGAALIAPARVSALRRQAGGWSLDLEYQGGSLGVEADIILDCGGRSSRLLAPFGARRRRRDRLFCTWVYGTMAGPRAGGMVYTESAPDGWWYTAPLSDGRRVLAWHTDADLPASDLARDRTALLAQARRSATLAAELADSDFATDAESPRAMAAHSSDLTAPVGDGWLAAGDAALSLDPLSSQGLFNALYTGLAAAETADRSLAGDPSASPDYAAALARIYAAYRRNLAAYYGLERRWPAEPFWQRRSHLDAASTLPGVDFDDP